MIDVSKLSPAPWTVYQCEGCWDPEQACGLNGAGFDCSHDECHHPLSLADAAFIALARNAFDVMLRRGWHSFYLGEDCWMVRDERGKNVYPDCSCPDPFTALVEADKWYKENVEKG